MKCQISNTKTDTENLVKQGNKGFSGSFWGEDAEH